MKPAETIIEKLGGDRAVSELMNLNISTVVRWRLPKERGGTGGLIPSNRVLPLIKAATICGVVLSPDDFFPTHE